MWIHPLSGIISSVGMWFWSWWLSGGKEGILSELLGAVLCMAGVHNGMQT